MLVIDGILIFVVNKFIVIVIFGNCLFLKCLIVFNGL